MRFIDTSYLLALELANDQNYSAAQAHSPCYMQVGTTFSATKTKLIP